MNLLKLQKQLEKSLKKENAAFKKLSKAKQRIEIAKDVIVQLKNKTYFAETGTYVGAELTEGAEQMFGICYVDELNTQTNLAMKMGMINCDVCAKGALVMSHIMKTNDCETNELDSLDDSSTIVERLHGVFEENQLHLIETAFECDERFIYENDVTEFDEEEITRAVKFGERYSNETNRLIAICKNIIKNKGTFKP